MYRYVISTNNILLVAYSVKITTKKKIDIIFKFKLLQRYPNPVRELLRVNTQMDTHSLISTDKTRAILNNIEYKM